MSKALVLDRIQTSLTRLRLPRMGEILEKMVQAAEQGSKSYLSFLDDLLETNKSRHFIKRTPVHGEEKKKHSLIPVCATGNFRHQNTLPPSGSF